MHKVFISYHHSHDQRCKKSLVAFGRENKIFVDRSVDTGDMSDALDDEAIREKIRDEYLRDSTVTIVGGHRNQDQKARRLGDLFEHVRRSSKQEVWCLSHKLAEYR